MRYEELQRKKYREWTARQERRRQERVSRVTREPAAVVERRRNRARRDYAYFVKTYFPEVARSGCGQFQVDAANYIKSHPNARAVFEWARGHAKSTHMGVFVPMWLKIQKERQFHTMVLVSKSEQSAIRLLADLQQQLEFNELYIHDFGEQLRAGSWADGEFITNDDCYFTALGRGQSPRGLKNNGRRPDYIIIDDLDDDEMCRNPARVQAATDWVLTALFGTMEAGRGRFIMVGNLIAKTSVLQMVIDRPGIHCTTVNILDDDGNPTWKENYQPSEIEEMRATMGERRFQREYMNNPITEGAIFRAEDIHYGQMMPLSRYAELVCYTDPSFRSGKSADYKATILVGVTRDGFFHVLKAYCEQTTVSNMIGWHYQIMDSAEGVTIRYYMEANFIQDLLKDEFDKVGSELGYRVPLREDKRAKGDKFARIENMQPIFSRGLVLFNEDEKGSVGMQNLVEQLLLFEKGSRAHDDGPDALESAIWMLNRDQQKRAAPFKVIERAVRHY